VENALEKRERKVPVEFFAIGNSWAVDVDAIPVVGSRVESPLLHVTLVSLVDERFL